MKIIQIIKNTLIILLIAFVYSNCSKNVKTNIKPEIINNEQKINNNEQYNIINLDNIYDGSRFGCFRYLMLFGSRLEDVRDKFKSIKGKVCKSIKQAYKKLVNLIKKQPLHQNDDIFDNILNIDIQHEHKIINDDDKNKQDPVENNNNNAGIQLDIVNIEHNNKQKDIDNKHEAKKLIKDQSHEVNDLQNEINDGNLSSDLDLDEDKNKTNNNNTSSESDIQTIDMEEENDNIVVQSQEEDHKKRFMKNLAENLKKRISKDLKKKILLNEEEDAKDKSKSIKAESVDKNNNNSLTKENKEEQEEPKEEEQEEPKEEEQEEPKEEPKEEQEPKEKHVININQNHFSPSEDKELSLSEDTSEDTSKDKKLDFYFQWNPETNNFEMVEGDISDDEDDISDDEKEENNNEIEKEDDVIEIKSSSDINFPKLNLNEMSGYNAITNKFKVNQPDDSILLGGSFVDLNESIINYREDLHSLMENSLINHPGMTAEEFFDQEEKKKREKEIDKIMKDLNPHINDKNNMQKELDAYYNKEKEKFLEEKRRIEDKEKFKIVKEFYDNNKENFKNSIISEIFYVIYPKCHNTMIILDKDFFDIRGNNFSAAILNEFKDFLLTINKKWNNEKEIINTIKESLLNKKENESDLIYYFYRTRFLNPTLYKGLSNDRSYEFLGTRYNKVQLDHLYSAFDDFIKKVNQSK